LEWSTKERGAIVVTGLLVKIQGWTPQFDQLLMLPCSVPK
jgi:hypothetical protein